MNKIKYNTHSIIMLFIAISFLYPSLSQAFWPFDKIDIKPDSPLYFLDTFFEDLELTLFPSRGVDIALQKVKERKEEFEYLKYKDYEAAEKFKDTVFKKDLESLEKELRKLPPEALPSDSIKSIVDDKILDELDFLKGDEFKFVKHGLMDFPDRVFTAEDFGMSDKDLTEDDMEILDKDLLDISDETFEYPSENSRKAKVEDSKISGNMKKETIDDEVDNLSGDLDSLLNDLESF